MVSQKLLKCCKFALVIILPIKIAIWGCAVSEQIPERTGNNEYEYYYSRSLLRVYEAVGYDENNNPNVWVVGLKKGVQPIYKMKDTTGNGKAGLQKYYVYNQGGELRYVYVDENFDGSFEKRIKNDEIERLQKPGEQRFERAVGFYKRTHDDIKGAIYWTNGPNGVFVVTETKLRFRSIAVLANVIYTLEDRNIGGNFDAQYFHVYNAEGDLGDLKFIYFDDNFDGEFERRTNVELRRNEIYKENSWIIDSGDRKKE